MPVIGSSPRGRGTLPLRGPRRKYDRFIPAWAGNTLGGSGGAGTDAVHPRVGGEHPSAILRLGVPNGSSPRGRGTPPSRRKSRGRSRFIPAWAGNTCASVSFTVLVPVHPRVGGEHDPSQYRFKVVAGSSPRGRGTREVRLHRAQRDRFIPAWAGNTSTRWRRMPRRTVHPRVGGEHSCRNPMI